MRICTPLLGLALGLPATAVAEDFSCRNTDADIQCADGRCEIQRESFTPMILSRRGTQLEICAGAGCADGPITLRRARGDVDFLHAVATRVTSGTFGARPDLSVLYNRRTKAATLIWGGSTQVMECGPSE